MAQRDYLSQRSAEHDSFHFAWPGVSQVCEVGGQPVGVGGRGLVFLKHELDIVLSKGGAWCLEGFSAAVRANKSWENLESPQHINSQAKHRHHLLSCLKHVQDRRSHSCTHCMQGGLR